MGFRQPQFVGDALVAAEIYRRAVVAAERTETARTLAKLVESHSFYWQIYEEANQLFQIWDGAVWLPQNRRQALQLFAFKNSLHRLDGAVRLYGSAVTLCFNPAERKLGETACLHAKPAAVNEIVFIDKVARLRMRHAEAMQARDTAYNRAAQQFATLQESVYEVYRLLLGQRDADTAGFGEVEREAAHVS